MGCGGGGRIDADIIQEQLIRLKKKKRIYYAEGKRILTRARARDDKKKVYKELTLKRACGK